MSSPHRIRHDLYRATGRIDDPGHNKIIRINKDGGVCAVDTTDGGNRTLRQPSKVGIVCTVVLGVDGGDLTLTVQGGYNSVGDTDITLSGAGSYYRFMSLEYGGTYYWRPISQTGGSVAISGFSFLSDFDDLADAISTIGANGHLLIDVNETLAATTYTTPAGLFLYTDAGVLTLVSGTTMTVNGPIIGNGQVFDNSAGGSLTIKNQDVKPEWFGAVADGATDDAPAIQQAFDAATEGRVVFRAEDDGIYSVDKAVYPRSGTEVIGSGNGAFIRNDNATVGWPSCPMMLGNFASEDENPTWELGATYAVGDRVLVNDAGTLRNFTCIAQTGVSVDEPASVTGVKREIIVGTNITWIYYDLAGLYKSGIFGAGDRFALDATAAGDATVTVTTPAEAATANIGDVVAIFNNDRSLEVNHADSAFTWPTTYYSPRYNELNVIEDIDYVTGVITLRRPLYQSYDSVPTIRFLNGTDSTTDDPNGEPFAAVRDVRVFNMKLTSTYHSVLRFGGCVDIVLDNCRIDAGNTDVTCNGWTHTQIRNSMLRYTKVLMELAYGCHDVTLWNIYGLDLGGGSASRCIGIQATARNCWVRNSTIVTSNSRSGIVKVGGYANNCGVTNCFFKGPCTVGLISLGGENWPRSDDPVECTVRNNILTNTDEILGACIRINGEGVADKRHIITGNKTDGGAFSLLLSPSRAGVSVTGCDFRGNRFHQEPTLGEGQTHLGNDWDDDYSFSPIQYDDDDITLSGSLTVASNIFAGDVTGGDFVSIDQFQIGSMRMITGSVLTNATATEIFKVRVDDQHSFALLLLCNFYYATGVKNLSAARTILFTGHADSEGNIVSAAQVNDDTAGPTALGSEYSTLTFSADTVNDETDDFVTLRVTQTNDQTDDLRMTGVIIVCGAQATSSSKWDKTRLMRPLEFRLWQRNQKDTCTSELTIT